MFFDGDAGMVGYKIFDNSVTYYGKEEKEPTQ